MLPTPTGVGGPTRGETHKVSLPPGPCTFTCLATSFKEVVRLQGHKTTAISKQLGEYFDLAHPYRGRAGQAEYLGNTHPSENAQPGKERPTHVVTASARSTLKYQGSGVTQRNPRLGHYFVLDHSLIAKMVEQAKAQYLGCFGYREHLEEPLTLKDSVASTSKSQSIRLSRLD